MCHGGFYKGFLKTKWHARVRGILEGYSGDTWRKFGGCLEECLRKFVGRLEDIKRRLEGKNLVFLNLMF